MLIKPRRVRRSSKFTSRLKTGSRQRREYAASVYSMAVIQGLLVVSLLIAAVYAYRAVDAQAPETSLLMKLGLPVAFTVGALLAFRGCVRNVRAARQIYQDARDARTAMAAEAEREAAAKRLAAEEKQPPDEAPG